MRYVRSLYDQWAYLARYGKQQGSEIGGLTLRQRKARIDALSRIVAQENKAKG